MRATPTIFKRLNAADDAMMRAVMPAASAASDPNAFDYVRSAPLNRDVVATMAGTRLVRPRPVMWRRSGSNFNAGRLGNA